MEKELPFNREYAKSWERELALWDYGVWFTWWGNIGNRGGSERVGSNIPIDTIIFAQGGNEIFAPEFTEEDEDDEDEDNEYNELEAENLIFTI